MVEFNKHPQRAQRFLASAPRRSHWAPLASGIALGLLGILVRAEIGAREPAGAVVIAIESPTPAVILALSRHPEIDVRWVESGLIVCEARAASEWPPECGGRIVAERLPSQEIGLLRAPEAEAWRQRAAQEPAITAFLAKTRTASLVATAGRTWLLESSAGQWPEELRGCHGGLVLPDHHVTPASLLDHGPPPPLAMWLQAPGAAFSTSQAGVLGAISADSLAQYLGLLAVDPLGRPADRFVFDADLENLYVPRVEAVMRRAVQGLPGGDALVRREAFAMHHTVQSGDSISSSIDSTYNVIARVPGSVPGTGTFVVCAHLDATGLRNAAWLQAAKLGQPVQTPGAEDNASGVACVLEMLRNVAAGVRADSIDLAFDVEFIAFSGEELPPFADHGLWGSAAYVQRRVAAGTPLLGAFNMDMVGYDSVGTNLQIVYNVASRWMSRDVIQPAYHALQPPSWLQLTPQLDEAQASDHNNFWNVNAPAILAADARINDLRSYSTYHRPIDTSDKVQIAKLAEVSRILTAALLRFDTRQSLPVLTMSPEDLTVRLDIQGIDIAYNPRFHRLWPGSALSARLFVHSLGATFTDTLHVEIAKLNGHGRSRLDDRRERLSLPPGARYEWNGAIPIAAEDAGLQRLEARVTYSNSTGPPVVQTAVDSFYVNGPQAGLGLRLGANPMRGDPTAATLRFALDRPGELRVDVYNVRGQRVASNRRDVVPLITTPEMELPLFGTAGTAREAADLPSGLYFVHARWRGSSGGNAEGTTRLVLIR